MHVRSKDQKCKECELDNPKHSIETIISEWLKNKPGWYSAALHAALVNTCGSEVIDALACAACRESNVQLKIDNPVELKDYQLGDIANTGISSREVVLKSVTATSGINAIPQGSKIDFAVEGLTVVYGNNGSGKSGYSRIIRNMGASRTGSKKILSNVYTENETPTVSVQVLVDGLEKEFTWKQGELEYPTFPEITFFDSTCASKEMAGRDNEILYSPEVVKAMERLSSLVSQVSIRIKDEEKECATSLVPSSVPAELREVEPIKTLLNCESVDKADKILTEAALTTDDEDRLRSLPKLIETDPGTELPKLMRRKTQLESIRNRLAALYKNSNQTFIDAHRKAAQEELKAEEAAKAARSLLNESTKLDGIGGDAWKTLWEAARAYSETDAFPGELFPKEEEGALCPLCQQPLSKEAVSRLATFESFVKGAAESNLSSKRKKKKELEQRFENAVNDIKADSSAAVLVETEEAQGFIDELLCKLEDITVLPENKTLEELSKLTASAGKAVRTEIDSVDEDIKSAREATQPGKADKLKAELKGLRARKWVMENKALLEQDVAIRERKKDLESIANNINTRQTSTLAANISKVEIVEKMQSCFVTELQKLKANKQPVSIATRTKAGQQIQHISLNGTEASAESVLSEGEQKIVALAGFFALLDVLPGKSTVVLDDPITSLDHHWRKSVASRIAEEATKRPIVLFTHEPMFCNELSEAISQDDTSITYRTVYKRNMSAGIVTYGLDWEACNVKERIIALRDKATTIRQRAKAGEFKSDVEMGRELCVCYSDLRSTWEQAVESVLLAGVVERARRPVHTQKLKSLSDIKDEDIRVVEENMTKCSVLTNAHDDPFSAPDSLPTIEDFEADIAVLDSWRKTIEKRRQKPNKSKS